MEIRNCFQESLNQAIRELKDNFKIVDKCITEEKTSILILNTKSYQRK